MASGKKKKIRKGNKKMKVKYTCYDVIQSIEKDYVIIDIPSAEDVTSAETWEKIKKRFSRKHHTKPEYVDITGIEHLK